MINNTTLPSKNHHFLPRHYLEGFTNNKGMFFVYDKMYGNIFKSSPGNTFFEKHLNTVTFPKGHSSDFLENVYAHIEGESWGAFNRIRGSSKNTKIELLDEMSLFFFLLCLHWRLPTNISIVDNLSDISFNEDDILNYFTISRKDGKKAPKEIIYKIKSSSAFKKSLKLILPFAPFFKNGDWGDDIKRWRFLYPADGKDWYLVGDNPIVTEGVNDNDPLKCLNEFVFPVSGKILLVNTNPPINHGFPSELVMEFNMAIIERSKRFVACPKEDWLGAVVKYYNFYKSYDKTHTIIPNFLNGLKKGIV